MGNSNDSNSDGPSWSVSGNATCLDWRNDPNAIWPYCPSLGAAVLFAVLYCLSTLAHLGEAIYYKKPFSWVLIMGGLWEAIGYIIRAVATQAQQALYLYVPQQLLILLAPLWVNAFMYMVFGRLVLFFVPDQKVLGIRARWLTLIFVLADILTFLVQAGGGAQLSDTDPTGVRRGQQMYMAGVGVQEACLLFYTVLVGLFHTKMRRVQHERPTNWRRLTYVLYAAVALVSVRNFFRLAEYANFESDTTHLESLFYIFDALLIFSTLLLFNVFHPGRVLVGPESEFPARAEKKRAKQARKEEKKLKKEAERQGKIEKNSNALMGQAEV